MKKKEKRKKGELSEEQRQEIREAFELFDTDGSGKSALGCARTPTCCALRFH